MESLSEPTTAWGTKNKQGESRRKVQERQEKTQREAEGRSTTHTTRATKETRYQKGEKSLATQSKKAPRLSQTSKLTKPRPFVSSLQREGNNQTRKSGKSPDFQKTSNEKKAATTAWIQQTTKQNLEDLTVKTTHERCGPFSLVALSQRIIRSV